MRLSYPAMLHRAVLSAGLLMVALACAQQAETTPYQITTTRQAPRPGVPADAALTDSMRFGIDPAAMAMPVANQGGAGAAANPGGMGAPGAGVPAPPPALLDYTLPAGWTEVAATQFRQVNLRIEDKNSSDPAEVYVTVLPGEGGGVAANVNRWRAQIGQEPLSEAELADLPTLEMLGGQAVALDLEGAFRGMGAGGARENYGMLGALLVSPERSVFVKLTAPAAVKNRERAAFEQFVSSLAWGASDDGHGHAAGAPAGGDPHAGMAMPPAAGGDPHAGMAMPPAAGSDPHAGMAMPPAAGGDPHAGMAMPPAAGSDPHAGMAMPGAEGALKLTYKAPDAWKAGKGDAMRLATFNFGDGPNPADVSLMILPGTGGGLVENVNRWRRQMGQPPMEEAQVSALPVVEMGIGDARLVELEGSYTGMNGVATPEAMMLGAIGEVDGHSVFVKLTGPKAEVAKQRAAFLEFCRSVKKAE